MTALDDGGEISDIGDEDSDAGTINGAVEQMIIAAVWAILSQTHAITMMFDFSIRIKSRSTVVCFHFNFIRVVWSCFACDVGRHCRSSWWHFACRNSCPLFLPSYWIFLLILKFRTFTYIPGHHINYAGYVEYRKIAGHSMM